MSTSQMDQIAVIREPCAECGMQCDPGEYHPFAACLMFKQCRDSETVRANLEAVVHHGFQTESLAVQEPVGEVVVDALRAPGNKKLVLFDASDEAFRLAEGTYKVYLAPAVQPAPALVDPICQSEPSADLIDHCAQRLVSWDGDFCVWPDSWDKADVAAARRDAEKVLRSAYSRCYLVPAASPIAWVDADHLVQQVSITQRTGQPFILICSTALRSGESKRALYTAPQPDAATVQAKS